MEVGTKRRLWRLLISGRRACIPSSLERLCDYVILYLSMELSIQCNKSPNLIRGLRESEFENQFQEIMRRISLYHSPSLSVLRLTLSSYDDFQQCYERWCCPIRLHDPLGHHINRLCIPLSVDLERRVSAHREECWHISRSLWRLQGRGHSSERSRKRGPRGAGKQSRGGVSLRLWTNRWLGWLFRKKLWEGLSYLLRCL